MNSSYNKMQQVSIRFFNDREVRAVWDEMLSKWGYEEKPKLKLKLKPHDCALNPIRSLGQNRENGRCHSFFSNLMTNGFENNLQASPIFNISTPTLAHKVANTQFSARLRKLLIFNTLYL